MTQIEKVLRHMQEFGSISSWEAIMEYGITRLGARIYELKKLGYPISSERQSTKNRFGENVSYAVYRLGGTNEKENI